MSSVKSRYKPHLQDVKWSTQTPNDPALHVHLPSPVNKPWSIHVDAMTETCRALNSTTDFRKSTNFAWTPFRKSAIPVPQVLSERQLQQRGLLSLCWASQMLWHSSMSATEDTVGTAPRHVVSANRYQPSLHDRGHNLDGDQATFDQRRSSPKEIAPHGPVDSRRCFSAQFSAIFEATAGS